MGLLNVLFWNVQKKDLTEQIVNIVRHKNVDILVLAENPVSDVKLIQALNIDAAEFFLNHPDCNCTKITILTKFDYNFINPIQFSETPRMTIRRVHLPLYSDFLFIALHLVDKRSYSTDSQFSEAIRYAQEIDQIEEIYQNNKTVIVGDFNMNPFETGMINAMGFHGTMSSEIARTSTRTVQGKDYKYFYNPTWSLFGDLNKTVSGTYYYHRSEHICYEWNIFDQVLIRPALIDNFVKESLEIISTDGINSLITTKGRPNKSNYSDHLPLFFTLKF